MITIIYLQSNTCRADKSNKIILPILTYNTPQQTRPPSPSSLLPTHIKMEVEDGVGDHHMIPQPNPKVTLIDKGSQWRHFKRGPRVDKCNHYMATCNYCGQVYRRGKVEMLRRHLANNCVKVPMPVRQEFKAQLLEVLNNPGKQVKREIVMVETDAATTTINNSTPITVRGGSGGGGKTKVVKREPKDHWINNSKQSTTIALQNAGPVRYAAPFQLNSNDYRDHIVRYCFSELVDLESVCSPSFRNIAHLLLKAAHISTNPKQLASLQYDLSNLDQNLQHLYEQEKNVVMDGIKYCIDRNVGGAIVSDLRDNLCVMSVTYIDKDWKPREKVLRAAQVDNVGQFILDTLIEYGLMQDTNILNKFAYVSNSDGFPSGLEVHLASIANIIDHCVEVAVFADGQFDQLIENCRHICKELKLLPMPTCASWIYNYELIETVLNSTDKFVPANFSLDTMIETMTMIYELLKPFKETSTSLRESVTKRPTINQVVLECIRLKKFLAIKDESTASNFPKKAAVKEALLNEFTNNVNLQTTHKIGVFLWPNFRHLKMFDDAERQEIYNEVRRHIESMQHSNLGLNADGSSTMRSQDSIYAEWESTDEIEQDEVSRYITDQCNNCGIDNLIEWWREASCRYPKLSQLAKSILSIPASVTSIDKRVKLKADIQTNEKMLFLHCNLGSIG